MKNEPSQAQLATAYIHDRLDRMDKARRRVARRGLTRQLLASIQKLADDLSLDCAALRGIRGDY